jgi:hypothetical protein
VKEPYSVDPSGEVGRIEYCGGASKCRCAPLGGRDAEVVSR